MTQLRHVLRDLVRLFDHLGIPYAVMGGIAVRVYGIPRPTHDIDFTASIPRPDLPAFYRAVEQLGYTVPEQYASGWVNRVAEMPVVKVRLYLEGNGVDVDLFLAESAFQEELLARRREEAIDDLKVWLVSPEDLILLKLLAHRPRDLSDAADILFVQGQLDLPHMRRWAEQLGVGAALQRLLSESPQS